VTPSQRNPVSDQETKAPPSDPPSAAPSAEAQGAGRSDRADAVRSRLASLVWLVAVVCATVLAVAALLVALRADHGNAVVSLVEHTAHRLDLGVLGLVDGILTPKHDPHQVEVALVSWSIAAVLYLVVGKIADRIVRP
jgi:hypothetical protein